MDSFFNTRIAYQALEAIINVYYFKYAKHNIQIADLALLGSDMAIDDQKLQRKISYIKKLFTRF
jgi:hypothetical protein